MIRLSAALAAALALTASPVRAECVLGKLLTLPVTMFGTRPTVEARLNGKPVRLEVDSGSFYSMLSKSAVAELHLDTYPAPFNFRVTGVGGDAKTVDVAKAKFGIGKNELPNVEFVVVPGLQSDYGVVGLLGRNILQHWDVDYDFAHGEISLMRPRDCGARGLAYWSPAANVISMIGTTNPSLRPATAWIKVNGHDVKALFDTGAGSSGMSLDAAHRIGLDVHGPKAVEAGMSQGIGTRMSRRWIVPVAELKLGEEIIKNTKIAVSDYQLSDVDMLIGADFFLSHHVYIANGQERVYFTYNGGPVFDLSIKPGAAPPPEPITVAAAAPNQMGAPAAEAAAASTTSAPVEADPADADGYSRRGQARLARRDVAGALSDLSRAVELDPQSPRYLRERALLRLETRQLFLAMNDLDAALKLAPDDPETLLLRARLRASGRDRTGAEADLDAASRAAAKQADVRLGLGQAWTGLGRYDRAVAEYDQWLQFHDGDAKQAGALNGRCWARALAGTELDQALRDCNAAVRQYPKNAAFLDSRGLVHLRRGELPAARADYDAALAVQPKLAWALYGRGVAKTRAGDAAGGQADLTAAAALNASLTESARKVGVTPS